MQSTFDESVFQKVVLAINRTTRGKAPQVSLSTRLADDLALGKRGRLMLALHLEDIFDIELPDDVSNGFVSVADIVAYSSSRYL
jgi:acyl carrier protein